MRKDNFKYMSVFALFAPCENLTLKGTKYPLENYNLQPGSSLCVSNEILGDEAEIIFEKGKLLVILSEDTGGKNEKQY